MHSILLRGWFWLRILCVTGPTKHLHSQKQSAHWAVSVTAQVVLCWLGSWLDCNLWLFWVSGISWNLIDSAGITGVQCLNAADSGDIQLSEWKITWISYIWTPKSSLHLINPFNWILTESWLRWWYTVGWAILSESVYFWMLYIVVRITVWAVYVLYLWEIYGLS